MGTASAKAVSTSLAVTARSLRTLARCNRSPSVDSVSEADGSSRGLTIPLRDRNSHSAKIAITMAIRASLSPSEPGIAKISGFCRNRLELGRDDLRRGGQILHAAGPGHIERQLHLLRNVGAAHAAVDFQFQNRVFIFECGDLGRNLVEIGN